MAQSFADLLIRFIADTTKFNTDIGKMGKNMGSVLTSIRDNSFRTSVALGALAGTSMGMAGLMVASAKRFEVMRTQLQLTLGSTEAVNQKMAQFGQITKDSMNFSLENVVQAGAVLEHFKKGASDVLPAIAGLAERLGKDLPGTAEVFARALSGDSRSMQMLARQFNISKQTLQEFDSAFDMTGQNAQKNGEILMKYLNANYGEDLKTTAGTLESQMGTLKMTVEELSASIGTAMLPVVKGWASMLQQVADKFNNMDESQKKVVANIIAMTPLVAGGGAAVTSLGSQVLQVSMAYKILGGSFDFVTKRLDSFKYMLGGLSGVTKLNIFKTGDLSYKMQLLAGATRTQGASLAMATVKMGIWGAAIAATIMSVNSLANALREEFEWRERIKQIQLKNADDQQREEKAYQRFTKGLVMTAQERVDAIQEIYRRMRIARKQGNAEDLKSLENQLNKIRAMTKGSEGSQAPARAISGGSTVDLEAEQAKMERDIVLLERRKELQGLSIAQTKELIGLYRTMASTRQNEAKVAQDKEEQNKLDEEAHQWRVKAKTLNDELIKQETKKGAVQKVSAKEAVDGNKQVVSSLSEVVGAIGSAIDAERQRAQERKTLAEQLDDDIRRITMSSEDYEMYKIQKKVEELRSAGIEEVKITAWVEAQRQDLIEKTMQKNSSSVDSVKSKFDELKREIESLEGKGSLSIGEGLRLMSLRSKQFLAGSQGSSAPVSTPTFNLPSVADIVGTGGAGATAQMASRTVNYNVSVNGLQIGGETGKKIAELMTNALVSKDDILAGAETV